MQTAYKFLSSLLILLFSLSLSSQDFDLIKIRSAYYPSQSIEDSSVDGEVGFFVWNGTVMVPQVFKNKKTILTHRASYSNLRVDTKANLMSDPIEVNRHYHTISYNLGLIQSLNPKWRLMLNLNPTIASDLESSLTEDDFLYQANAVVVNNKSKKLSYGFGLAFTTRFGRQLILPTGMVRYRTPKMDLNVLLPTVASIMFKSKSQTFLYGFEASINGALFNNTSDVETITTAIDETGYSRFLLGPALELRLQNGVKVQANGGVAVGRRLEFIDVNEEIFDRAPEVGPFFSLGLSFSPKKDKAEKSSK